MPTGRCRAKNSAGVARQYAGAAGKLTNCQTLVSLTLARGEVPVGLALRLFLPAEWTEDAARCQAAGSNIGALCQTMHRQRGVEAIRHIQGILSLAKKHGAATVDAACAVALEAHAGQYHFVRRYIDRQPAPPLTLRQVDPIIRQLSLYRDLIADKTGENQS